MKRQSQTENQLEIKLGKKLRQKGLQVFTQVRLCSKRVDLVYIEKRKSVNSVELKLTNWKEAVRQAYLNKYNFHKSYVAIYANNSRRLKPHFHIFRKLGIGLLFIDREGNSTEVIGAKYNYSPNSIFLNDFRNKYKTK